MWLRLQLNVNTETLTELWTLSQTANQILNWLIQNPAP